MTLALTVVDSFTDRPFTGNPAAVAIVDAIPPTPACSRWPQR